MNEKWTDFEKYVFKEFSGLSKKIEKISNRITTIEAKAATWGGIAGALVAVIGEALVKSFWHK